MFLRAAGEGRKGQTRSSCNAAVLADPSLRFASDQLATPCAGFRDMWVGVPEQHSWS